MLGTDFEKIVSCPESKNRKSGGSAPAAVLLFLEVRRVVAHSQKKILSELTLLTLGICFFGGGTRYVQVSHSGLSTDTNP